MPTCPRHADPTGGFTLIEMLVVLTVMGLLAAVVAARTGPAAGAGFAARQAEQRLRAALADGVLTARRTGRPVVVAPGELIAEARVRPALATEREGTIVFYPDGSSSGGIVEVRESAVLEIDWLTGEARDAS
jgi:prepilin-type N-terminal cleavage/methylation domain-containing protein